MLSDEDTDSRGCWQTIPMIGDTVGRLRLRSGAGRQRVLLTRIGLDSSPSAFGAFCILNQQDRLSVPNCLQGGQKSSVERGTAEISACWPGRHGGMHDHVITPLDAQPTNLRAQPPPQLPRTRSRRVYVSLHRYRVDLKKKGKRKKARMQNVLTEFVAYRTIVP